MTKRTTSIFWACVGAIQLIGLVLDSVGGNLDDPARVVGLLLL